MARDDPQTIPRNPVHTSIGAIAGVIATMLGLFVLAYTILYITKGRFLKPTFERMVSERAGRPVRVAGDFQLYLHPDVKFRAEGLTLANPDWAHERQLFGAKLIDVDLSIWQLILGHQRITHLLVDGGRAGLESNANGQNTWTFAGDTKLTIPEIDRADIIDTRLSYIDALKRAKIDLVFGDVAARDKRIGAPLTFTGIGTAYGAPFTLKGELTTPDASIAGGTVGITLHANAVETAIDIAGMLPGATRIDGADLRVTVAGRNMQAPGRLFGIVLPATRPYRLNSHLTKNGRDYFFDGMNGRIGTSDIGGNLRVTAVADINDKLRINGKLHSRTLDILDVGPLIGYSPEKLDAQGGKGAITMVGGHPRVLPDAPLAISELKAFDAHIDYSADAVRTGNAPIANLKLGFYLENSKLDLDPLNFEVFSGKFTSTIGIDARVQPVLTKYDIALAQVPIGQLLKSFKVEDSGTTASVHGHLQLTGHGDTVRKSLATSDGRIALIVPRGTLWVRNVELAKLDIQNFLTAIIGKRLKKPTEIRCGIVAFTVKGGKATADPILFDTTRANYRVTGGFDFSDEALSLSLRGKSKEFSLFSGQSPIGIGGYFAAPTVNPISGQLIARGGAAVALGVVASPLAAIIAFVDFGGTKSNDCAPVLAGDTAAVIDAAPKGKDKHAR